MEGPTYKGREERGKRRGRVPPPVIRFSPGPRGARIVTACARAAAARLNN